LFFIFKTAPLKGSTVVTVQNSTPFNSEYYSALIYFCRVTLYIFNEGNLESTRK